uniref:Uncharacterized protein n=1 Tax=Panagrolaimus sp. ES5 TaxID=591445 RepID=A0AC34GNV6_9BILA
MPDELDNFFAKKKNKDKKKKNVLHVGDIAEYLDHTNRNLELLEHEEKEQRHNEKEAKEGENKEEDSEWLEAPEEDISTKFAEIGIKDMDASELTEDEEEHEAKVENSATKTWKNAAVAVDPSETPQYTITTSKKYVPPVGRTSRRAGAEFDLKNEEMFPSIANADKIEKVEKSKEDRKTIKANQQAGWKTQENKPSNIYRPPPNRPNNNQQISNVSQTHTATAPAPTPVKTNKYVPPAKRNV